MAYLETDLTKNTSIFRTVVTRFAIWRRNWRTRQQLAELPPAMLDDIGVSPHQARKEARRLF